ncbi:leucine-rich repeat domain-containing protein [Nitrospira sp. CMX1]
MDGMQIARELIAEEREKQTGFLDLGNLELTEVPTELFELTHLRELNLGSWYLDKDGKYQESCNGDSNSSNSLGVLPSTFGALPSLLMLSLAGNPITDLSPLQACTALQQLNCAGTQVTDLSPLISIPSLQRFIGDDCHLKDFPRRLLFRENLQKLVLHETTIPGIPTEVLSADLFSSCLEELRAHLVDVESGSEEIREVKLVVLGNGRVGKTQICRRLRGLPYDDTVVSTHGINVTAEPWADSTNEEILNIWDFGGQDIYHGAHTLFMKTSAVFLIAWHPDFETTGEQSADGIWFRNYPLPYWLEYVRTLGRKDCPVIVVQARCDRPEQDVHRLPVDDALLTFPSLKPCWYSAKTKRGDGALNDALQDAIEYLKNREEA